MQKVLTAIMPLPFAPLKIGKRSKFNFLGLLTAGAVVCFIVVCVIQANAYARDIYLIKDYQNRIAQVSEENKIMEFGFLGSNSLASVNAYAQSQSFEKVDRIEYIKLLGGTAVAR